MDAGKAILNEVKNRLVRDRQILGLFLYGNSNFGEDFHIDLFIIVENQEKISITEEIMAGFSNYPLKSIIKVWDDLDKINPEILQDLFKNGKILYWDSLFDTPASTIFKLKPHTLFTFNLKGMTQLQKVQFNYQLYGKKNTGQLQEWSGIRVAKSCFYVPHANKYKVTRFFSKFNINNENFDIWL